MVIGRSEVGQAVVDNKVIINISSDSPSRFRGLSNHVLGPVRLYGDYKAKIIENAWQYSKVYPEHVGAMGEPTEEYIKWAEAGWNSDKVVMFTHAPKYIYRFGEKLSPGDAREKYFVDMYVKAALRSHPYASLKREYVKYPELLIYDNRIAKADTRPFMELVRDASIELSPAYILREMLEGRL